ncbi:Sorting nexin-12 [Fusarium oxysporum f. sp. albedinis]|nr:Sorting nexin-12 [Fusarium oxysporum f. sp. albedinis]
MSVVTPSVCAVHELRWTRAMNQRILKTIRSTFQKYDSAASLNDELLLTLPETCLCDQLFSPGGTDRIPLPVTTCPTLTPEEHLSGNNLSIQNHSSGLSGGRLFSTGATAVSPSCTPPTSYTVTCKAKPHRLLL